MDPMFFLPFSRPMVWGGRRLADVLGKPLPTNERYGESWEISGHPLHPSEVAAGKWGGWRLDALVREHGRELLGVDIDTFPLLIKFLDCHELLSVQVHPNDALAARLRPGERGKTEAWIILAAEPTARVYAGLKPGIDRTGLTRLLAEGAVADALHSFVPKPGDCLFLPAGVVHAVGGGVLMAEVQQNSDATFRLFDWNRMGTDGKPRTLHVAESLEAIAWDAGPVNPVSAPPPSIDEAGQRRQPLVTCPYFTMTRQWLDRDWRRPSTPAPEIVMVLDGSAALAWGNEAARALPRGATLFMPANAVETAWRPASDNPSILLRVTDFTSGRREA